MQNYTLDDIFNPASALFNGAFSFALPPSAQNAFLGGLSSAVIVNGGAIDRLSIDELVARNLFLSGLTTFGAPPQLPVYTLATLPNISADAGADDASVGTVAWSSPANAVAYTGLLATTSDVTGAPVTSHYLKVTDFDYNIPSDATILGIQVEIDKALRAGTSALDSAVRLVKADGTFATENKANATAWGAQRIDVYGGPTDLWGETWTPADINDIDFGAALSVLYTNSVALGGPGVGMIKVVVFYTNMTGSAGMGSIAWCKDGRKGEPLETAGQGTGIMVVNDGRVWCRLDSGFGASVPPTWINELEDDTTPELGGDLDLNDHDVLVDGTPDTDQTASGDVTDAFQAGASITLMDVVYMGSASKWLQTDANAAATAADVDLAVSLQSKTNGLAMKVALPGSFVRNDAWNWTPGVPLYLSETAAGITATAPTTSGAIIRKIGTAYTADVIRFDPSSEYSIAP